MMKRNLNRFSIMRIICVRETREVGMEALATKLRVVVPAEITLAKVQRELVATMKETEILTSMKRRV